MSAFLDPYVRAMRANGISTVFSHHTRKAGRDYRGSGAIGAKVDAILLMRRPSTGVSVDETNELEDDLELDDGRRVFEGRGRGIPHFALRLSFAGGRYLLGEAPLPLRDRILAAIPITGATTRSIREKVRGRHQAITDLINELESEGRIRRDGNLWQHTIDGSLSGSRGQFGIGREPAREPSK